MLLFFRWIYSIYLQTKHNSQISIVSEECKTEARDWTVRLDFQFDFRTIEIAIRWNRIQSIRPRLSSFIFILSLLLFRYSEMALKIQMKNFQIRFCQKNVYVLSFIRLLTFVSNIATENMIGRHNIAGLNSAIGWFQEVQRKG